MIHDLWQTAQSIPQYKNKTALVVSTDHGRGDGREGWKSHSATLPGSDKIWIAVIGLGIEPGHKRGHCTLRLHDDFKILSRVNMARDW